MPEENKIVRVEPQDVGYIIPASSPQEIVNKATAIAKILADIIEKKKLYVLISGKKHVKCEGWTTLGAFIGVLPAEESVTKREDGSYEATVKLIRARDGVVIGRASAEVSRQEKNWKDREDYAMRSMALTRATGKAFRLGFSWIMVLGGYAATPAEEIAQNGRRTRQAERNEDYPQFDDENLPEANSEPAQAKPENGAAYKLAPEWWPRQPGTNSVIGSLTFSKVTQTQSPSGKPLFNCVDVSGDLFTAWDTKLGAGLALVKGQEIQAAWDEVTKGEKTYRNLVCVRGE